MNNSKPKTREAYLEQLLREVIEDRKSGLHISLGKIEKELKEPDGSLISISEAVEFITGMLDAAAFLSEIINALSPDADVKKQVGKVLNTLDEGIKQLQEQLGHEPSKKIIEDEIIR